MLRARCMSAAPLPRPCQTPQALLAATRSLRAPQTAPALLSPPGAGLRSTLPALPQPAYPTRKPAIAAGHRDRPANAAAQAYNKL